MVDRTKLASLLHDIGVYLDLLGENPFKVRAHENASRIIETFEGDLDQAIKDGTLTDIKGIGPALAEKITQFSKTEKIKEHDELKAKIPPGLLEMLNIQGLGPKKVRAIHDKLEINSIGELEYACRENRLMLLDGFGEKSQANVLKGIEFLKKFQDAFLYSDAKLEAELILAQLKTAKDVLKIEVAGSFRRKKEIVRDLDILVATKDPKGITQKFVGLKGVERVLAEGPTKSSVQLKSGMQVDLRVVTESEFPFALLYFTGSKEHNTEMRRIAKGKNLKLNEYGLFKGEKSLKCKTEEEIFKALDLEFIEPELRENMGEFQAKSLPILITQNQIKGIFHCHTTESDGTNSLEEMVSAAKDLGYEYIGISDHSESSVIANGLNKNRILDQFKKIEALQKKSKITILKGVEADILSDGSLDYDDDLLKKFDFVIGSLHLGLQMEKGKMLKRLEKALKNKYMDFLGHPTGRILLARDGINADMREVVKMAVKNHVVIELNANPQRLDMDWRLGPLLKQCGGKVSINPDAHSIAGLEDVEFGVGIARKAWLGPDDVLNALPWEKAKKFLKRYRNA